MAVQRINFTSIPVENQDRALAFYRDVLGFGVQIDAPYAEDWRWIFLTTPDGGTRLHFARKTELSWKEGTPALALVTDSVDADAVRYRAAGGEVVYGPEDTPWAEGARYLVIRDTEGNVIYLESAKASA